jgi:hypothetical protein
MKRLLKSPVVNAICISIFTAFYAMVFFTTSKSIDFENNLHFIEPTSFWSGWSSFLAAGHQLYIVSFLIAVTILVVVLLVIRRKPYDEYHTSILTHCLIVAVVLTLIAIAIFYLLILNEPTGIIEKFTLFIVIHWSTVVFANLTYVVLCRWR